MVTQATISVKSSCSDRYYTVQPEGDAPWCSCKDHQHRHRMCKHIREHRKGEKIMTLMPRPEHKLGELYPPEVMEGITAAVLNLSLIHI